MKKLFFLLLLLSGILFSGNAQSKIIKMGLAVVKVSDHNSILIGPALGYEKSLGQHLSLNLHADLSFHKIDDPVNDKNFNRNFDVEGEFRYFLKESLDGIFFGPFASYGTFEHVTKKGNTTGKGVDSHFRVGGSAGYQTFLNNRLNLSFRVLLGTAFQEESMKGSFNIGLGYCIY